METTWDMSPAKRKMFIVAASFLSFVRARAWNLIEQSLAVLAGLVCPCPQANSGNAHAAAGVDETMSPQPHAEPWLFTHPQSAGKLLGCFLVPL